MKFFIFTAALVLTIFAAAFAATGDTLTADLTGETLPSAGTYTAVKGSGTLTITEIDGTYFYWEVNLFDATKFSSIDLVLNAPGLPVLLTLTTEYIEDEIVFYGNFTRQYLDAQLEANGIKEATLYTADLWSVITFEKPAGSAIGGQISANSLADFTNQAPSPDSAPEDTFEIVATSIYVAQLWNVTVLEFESGMTPTNGTGSMIIQDMEDGTFEWTLDIALMKHPRNLSLLYFKTFGDQPTVLHLKPTVGTPRFVDEGESFEGSFNLADVQANLTALGAPPEVVEKTFNVTPPVLFFKLDDNRNGSIVGFAFDANAEPTERPIIKGEIPKSVAYSPTAITTTLMALTLALLSNKLFF